MVNLSLLAALAALSSTTTALKWRGAEPTAGPHNLPSIASRFKEPKPTLAPDVPYELLVRGAVPRDDSDVTITAFSAPDATCGFFDGRAGAPLSCGTADTCFMFASASVAAIGCCPISSAITDCGFRTDCINLQQYNNGSFCDSGCVHDTYTLKCTESSAPYCNALTWPQNSVHDFFCDDTYIKTTQTLYTTYSGETDRTWITNVYSGNPSSTAPTSSSSSSAGSSTTSSGGGGGGGSSPTPIPIPTPTPQPSSKSTPVGAIVGGVIGGLALIALICLAVFFFLRRSRNNDAANAAAPTVAGPPPGGPPAYMPDSAAKPPLAGDTNSYYSPAAGAAAAYGQHPNQSPEMAQHQPYPQHVQPGQPGYYDPNTPGGYYQPHPSPSNPATSPTGTTAFSTAGTETGHGGSGTGSTGAYGYSSPRPGFSEMSANMAGGPFPTDQHAGTFEVEGSAPPVQRPAGDLGELDGGRR